MLTTPSFKYVAILALLMASAVTLANILVQFVINDWLTWGAFTYPIVFVITDCTTRLFGGNIARKIMYVGVVVGIVFSLFFAPVQIAIASATAFIMGQLLDISVFSYLLKRCSAQLCGFHRQSLRSLAHLSTPYSFSQLHFGEHNIHGCH